MQSSNIITTKVVIVLSAYNNRTYVNKGLSKITRAKNIVAQKKKQSNQDIVVEKSAKEKLLEVYRGKEIDISDPNGYYLLNSGWRIKDKGGLGRLENEAFSGLMSDLFQREVFQQLAQSKTTPSEIMERAVDLNETLFASTAQMTRTVSSIEDLKTAYDYLKYVEKNQGNLFIFDTETIGGKNRTGIWNPLAITEFAMQEYSYATGETTKTNIVLGLADNADNTRVYNEIMKYMEDENWAAIEQNEELFVTAKRVALYENAEMALNEKTGYFEITRLGDAKNNWKSKEAFQKGWDNLRKAHDATSVTDNGLRRSDEALFQAVHRMQTQLNGGNAMALGQNFQLFDEPVVNMQLKKTFNFYKEILDDSTGKLAASRGISKNQAQNAVSYMNNVFKEMGGAFNLPNERTFDTMPLFQVVRDYFGAKTLYNGNIDAIKNANGGLARQENVGAAWFTDLFSDSMAHMADFDVTVLNYAATHKLDKANNKTLIEYLMTEAGKDKSGVYGIKDDDRLIKTGQVYYSRKGTGSFDYAGKGVLNFTHNEKTGEIFTSSGYKFVNGQNLGYEDTKINMGTDLKTGNFFTLESVKKVKAEDIHEKLGDIVPDMSGREFIVAQFKMALPEGESSNGLEYLSYNYLFNSEKQFSSFMSYDMKMAVDIDENGKRFILDNARDLFDELQFDQDGDLIRRTEHMMMTGQAFTDDDLINMTLKKSMQEFQTEKSYNSIFGTDSSYKNIEKMLNAKGFLESKEVAKLGLDLSGLNKEEIEELIRTKGLNLSGLNQEEITNIIDGKKIRNMTDEQAEYISKKVKKIMGFYNKALGEDVFYSNTQRNMINAWGAVSSQDKFFKTVLGNLNKEAKARNWNNNQKAAAFNDLVETLRVQAAELLSTGDTKLDKSRIANTKIKEMTAYQMSNTYDIKIPLNFSIDNSSHVRTVESFSSSDARDIIRLNLDTASPYNFVNRLKKEMYGSKELLGDAEYYQRKALSKYILNVLGEDENFKGTKAYKNIVKNISGKNKDDYNVVDVTSQIFKRMKQIKEENPAAAILKEINVHTLNMDEAMTTLMNSDEFLNDFVGYNIKNNLINPIDTKALLKDHGKGMKQFVEQNLMSKYMPSKEDMLETLKNMGATEQQIKMKTTLYDSLYEDISTQLTDILSIGSKIEGLDMAIGSDGTLTVVRHGQSATLKGIPKVEMDNGHLYGVLGNQKLNLHLDLEYDDLGKVKIRNNLGDKFENSRFVSNKIRKNIQDGDFRLDDFFNYVNKLGADLREEASYSGTSSDLLSNYYVGTKSLNKVLPQIFADEGLINSNFFDQLEVPNNIKAILRERMNKQFKIGNEIDDELDPALRQMIGPYRVNIMRELAKWNHQGGDIYELIDSLNVSSKDKSKLGKDVLVGGNVRFLTGFTNPIDENSRPVIGGSGNVRYLLDENIENAAKNAQGIFYKGALFESAETMYLNKAYQAGIGNMSTTFTGRTAYVGEIGLRTILENNKDKVLRENKVMINQVDQTGKVYDFLYSYLNTFEQAKVFSAETFDQITGGTLAADKKKLSLSKDIAAILELPTEENDKLHKRMWDLRGKLIRGEDGTITYISSTGEIVNHGDTLAKYAAYGGDEASWISKLNKGVMKYEIENRKGIVLSDKGINELLAKNKDMFEGLDFKEEGMVHSVFEKMLEKEGLTGQYVVEDVNKTTLPKILVNDAEKSMNQLGYMRIGTVNENIRGVLEEYGGDAKDFIGTTVPTPDALRAALKDEDKVNELFNKYRFKDMDDFIEAVKEESYAADRLIFGKNGLFKGFVAIGNDNLAGHKNKGSMLTGAINDAIAMLGKYELGEGVENAESLKLGFQKFVEIVNAGTTKDKDAFKFFKDSNGKGLNLVLGKDGFGLTLEGGRSLSLGLEDADVVDVEALENLFIRIDKIIGDKGAIKEDRLVHQLAKIDEKTGQILVKDGVVQLEEGLTLGRAVFQEVDGKKYAYGSSGAAGMKLVLDSETQSGMSAEYVDVKQQLRDMRIYKQQLLDTVQGRELNYDEAEIIADINFKIEGLEAKARDLKETGHLYKIGDRERNIFSQYLLNDEVYEKFDEGLDTDILLKNEAARGFNREMYTNDYKVFGFLEDELRGQLFYNPYEEDLLTESLLGKSQYSHLKGVYDDVVKKQGKQLGVKTAEDIYGVRMIELANQYNNKTDNVNLKTLLRSGYKAEDIMTPEEYIKSFAAMGADKSDNVVRRNIILDLGEEFETMAEWQGENRYIAIPGMGTSLEDVDIKKDWHKAASTVASIYQDEYMNLQGQDTETRTKVIQRLKNQVDVLNKSTSSYVTKKGILDEMTKTEIYAAMDRTKIMSLPDYKNPLLEQAMVHGDSVANWAAKGAYYDTMFDSYEMFEKRGFFKDETLKQFGMKDKSEMVEYLKTHGAVMVDDRYPNIRRTSLTTARHYLMDEADMHSTNATYMTKETLLKMLADSDGDSRSGFMLQQGTVSHALYERKRLQAIDAAEKMTFADDGAREAWIKQRVIDDGIDEATYDNFRGIDFSMLKEATTTNALYHERAVKTNIDDLLKTRRAQMIMGAGEHVIAELPDGKSILSRQKTLALNYDPNFQEVKSNLDEVNELLTIARNRMDDISKIDSNLADELRSLIPETNNILDYEKNEIDVLDRALYAVEQLGVESNGKKISGNVLDGATVKSMQKAVQQRVRINAYHAESLSKLGISAVGNVNHSFFGASQAMKNYYGVQGTSNYNKVKSEILERMSYEIEQSSISSKKITLKAGDTKVATLSDILSNIKRNGLGEGPNSNYEQAMEWMRTHADAGKAVKQFEELKLTKTPVEFGTGKKITLDPNVKADHEAIADYMYSSTIKAYAEVYGNEEMTKIANAYGSIGSRKASPYALEKAQGMLDNSFLGEKVRAITGEAPDTSAPKARGPKTAGDAMDEGYRRARQLSGNATDEAASLVRRGMGKIRHWATTSSGNGTGRALAMGVVGLAAGLVAAGYASGNPLNDANPEQVVQQQTKPSMSFGPDTPQMAPNNTGGYIINIKGDTRKGNRQLKKALKQAANSSVGGAVNINMSLRTSREGGYSNQDIENILSNYF